MAVGEAEEGRGKVVGEDVGNAVGGSANLDAFGERGHLSCDFVRSRHEKRQDARQYADRVEMGTVFPTHGRCPPARPFEHQVG